jgi:hypothetical protein
MLTFGEEQFRWPQEYVDPMIGLHSVLNLDLSKLVAMVPGLVCAADIDGSFLAVFDYQIALPSILSGLIWLALLGATIFASQYDSAVVAQTGSFRRVTQSTFVPPSKRGMIARTSTMTARAVRLNLVSRHVLLIAWPYQSTLC